MNISYNVAIEEKIEGRGSKGKWIPIITDFILSDNQNICFEFGTKKEVSTAYNSLFQGLVQRKKIKGITIMQRGLKVYVIKETKSVI